MAVPLNPTGYQLSESLDAKRPLWHTNYMRQLLQLLLIIALLLGSAEAAMDSAHINSDHHDSSHLLHDHDDMNTDVDHDEDQCNHYCHCIQHIGTLASHSSLSVNALSTLIGVHDYRYHYQPVSPLYRPPIA